jgi:hypothetical protein
MDPDQRERLSSVQDNPNPLPPLPPPPVPVAAPRKASRPVDYENMGRMAAGFWFGLGENLLGPDWKPNSTEEQEVPKAFTDVFRHYDIGDIPPGVALCLVLGVYTVGRLNKPTVRQRLTFGRAWFKEKIASWRKR